MNIASPLTGSNNVKKIKEIPSKLLVDNYKRQLDVDVSKYFKNLEHIDIYECLDSSFKFYSPSSIAGDGKFYEDLQKHSWYYPQTKWEHLKALEVVKGAKNLLEIGCGRGEFLEKVRNTNCIGLELNEDAVKKGAEKGLKILNESIEEYSKKHQNEFEVVCSFQVVEHIENVGEFIKASIDCLKPGGKLIICVPNNDSVLYKTGENLYLNMPPHHMGLWDLNSLIKLSHFFPIEIESAYLEPLQSYHAGFAVSIAKKKFREKLNKKKLNWIPLLKPLVDRIINMSVRSVSDNIIGHSIMVVYTKK